MFIPKKVIVHHSLTRDSGTVSWGAIRRYHMETLGWKACGYHIGVEQVVSGGAVYYEALMGRMWNRAGAHTRGHNHDSLGICFIGNYDGVPPPREALKAGAAVIALWMELYDIGIDDIYTHHHFNKNKTCPGSLFSLIELKYHIQVLRGRNDEK